MRIFRSNFNKSQFNKPVITLGAFDGLHLGHREILDRVKEKAKKIGGQSVVITFEPHPQIYFKRADFKLLSTEEEKILLMEAIGIDCLIILPFDDKFKALTALDFLNSIIVAKIDPSHIIVGYDNNIGCDRLHAGEFLKNISNSYSFTVETVEKQLFEADKVSSSVIRKLFYSGNLDRAVKLLTYPYIFIGYENNGELISLNDHKLIPTDGTYLCRLLSDDLECKSEITIVNSKIALPKCLNFNDNSKIRVEFIANIY